MPSTIVALSTPSGVSAIAVARVSGNAVKDVCRAILPKFDFEKNPRKAILTDAFFYKGGGLPLASTAPASGAFSATPSKIDSLIAIYFPAPNSYTGEDVLELFPHGNPFIIRRLIEAICAVGEINGLDVRLAERGEFTERAFLNGKLDLAQAEALGEILSARDEQTLRNAQRLLAGEMSSEIKMLADELRDFSARLELEVDFAEELSEELSNDIGLVGNIANGELFRGEGKNSNFENLRITSQSILEKLSNLRKRIKKPRANLPRIALFGAPNAGKSSLINALVCEDRLLVSEVSGTTRDFVEVPLQLSGGDALLVDTAGLSKKPQSEIDERAMQKSREQLINSNVKILVIDGSIPLPAEFGEWSKNTDLIVETHCDLLADAEDSQSQTVCSESAANKAKWFDANSSALVQKNCVYKVSCINGEGLEELKQKLNEVVFPPEEETLWITNERQSSCIKQAEECVNRAASLIAQKIPQIEIAAFEMRSAKNALRSIIGEITDESVLNEIFKHYCIGK